MASSHGRGPSADTEQSMSASSDRVAALVRRGVLSPHAVDRLVGTHSRVSGETNVGDVTADGDHDPFACYVSMHAQRVPYSISRPPDMSRRRRRKI